MQCDCCNMHQTDYVSSMPGIPVTISRCVVCIVAGNYPYGFMVAHCACVSDISNVSNFWADLLCRSLAYKGVTQFKFAADVSAMVDDMNNELNG